MNQLQKKIIAVTNELRASKDGKNTFANYNYFKPDDLLNLLNPLLLKHDLFCKFNLTYKDLYYEAELILADEKDKEVYKFDILKASVKGANEAQNSGATLTYAKRYSLMNAFNIAENSDDFDSDEHAKREIEAQRRADALKAKNDLKSKTADDTAVRLANIERINNCKTKAELLSVWVSLSKQQQNDLEELKNIQKTKLTE